MGNPLEDLHRKLSKIDALASALFEETQGLGASAAGREVRAGLMRAGYSTDDARDVAVALDGKLRTLARQLSLFTAAVDDVQAATRVMADEAEERARQARKAHA